MHLPVLDSVLDYEKLHRIGEGTYGVVYKGECAGLCSECMQPSQQLPSLELLSRCSSSNSSKRDHADLHSTRLCRILKEPTMSCSSSHPHWTDRCPQEGE
jgi:hypothetical protein